MMFLSKINLCNFSDFLYEVTKTNGLTFLEKILICGFWVKKGPKRVRNRVFQILTKNNMKGVFDFLRKVQ